MFDLLLGVAALKCVPLLLCALTLQTVIIWIALVKHRSGDAWGSLFLLIGPFALVVATLPEKSSGTDREHDPGVLEACVVALARLFSLACTQGTLLVVCVRGIVR